jgi:hypothetical protein
MSSTDSKDTIPEILSRANLAVEKLNIFLMKNRAVAIWG